MSSKESQKEEDGFDSYRNNNKRNTKGGYPTVPAGFECFVCGTKFATNEERVQHLEKTHMVVCMTLVHLKKERTLDDFVVLINKN